MRRVFCKLKNGEFAWAYKDDSVDGFIPTEIYKADFPNRMINEKLEGEVEFERWATLDDI